MKPRNAEAARLEADYLARVKAALAGREASEIDEIIESLREHVAEELSEAAGDQITLVQMANVLESLGPPESYAQEEGVTSGTAVVSGPETNNERPRLSKLAIASILCLPGALLTGAFTEAVAPRAKGPFIAAVLLMGVILGIAALVEIRHAPQTLRGRALAWIAVLVPPIVIVLSFA